MAHILILGGGAAGLAAALAAAQAAPAARVTVLELSLIHISEPTRP